MGPVCNEERAKEASFGDISNEVVTCLSRIWERASILSTSPERVKKMMLDYHPKSSSLMKSYNSKKNQNEFSAGMEKFRGDSSRICHVAACKCDLEVNECYCEKGKEVPVRTRAFLFYQRSSRVTRKRHSN